MSTFVFQRLIKVVEGSVTGQTASEAPSAAGARGSYSHSCIHYFQMAIFNKLIEHFVSSSELEFLKSKCDAKNLTDIILVHDHTFWTKIKDEMIANVMRQSVISIV